MSEIVRKNFLFIACFFALACILPLRAAAHGVSSAPGLADGAGVWVNMWNYPESDLDSYFADLHEHGIKNMFLQTSRSNTPAIVNPGKLGAMIEAAHRHGVRVIAWSFADLLDPLSDSEKMIAAARYTSPAGEHVDGASPNLEKNLEPWRVEKYAGHLREKLGADYPLIAVVYSPLNRCPEVRRISWNLLARYFDTIAPMIYWNSKYEKIEPYSYTVKTIKMIRELSGKPDVEISAIGDGMGSNSASITEFLKACRDAEATGLSLYPNHKITEEQKITLAGHAAYLKANSRFRMAALRACLKDGDLTVPPRLDPSQAISRRDFYRLVVRRLYPAFSYRAGESVRRKGEYLPEPSECKESSGEQALQILIKLGLLADIPEDQSIKGLLDSAISSPEALSIIAGVLELDRHLIGVRHPQRFDRWLVPSAQAAVQESPDGACVNYLDAAQMIFQASSGLR